MPIYEYQCKECGSTFEILHLPGRDGNQTACTKCGSTQVKKLISPPFLPSDVGKPANEEPVSKNTQQSDSQGGES